MSLRLLGLLLTAAAAGLPAQGAVNTGRAAGSDAAIRIWSLTGSLRITAWTRDSVHVQGRVDPGAGRFGLGGTREALKLSVEPPVGREPDGVADLDIRVPARARLWIKSAAADIEVTLQGGTVEVTSVGGRVRLAGQAASAAVETLDGNVELALEGPLARVRTASGTIVVRGVLQELDAQTVSGPLLVGMEGSVHRVRLETVASEIAFKGDLDADGHLEAATHGGDIELRLPPRLAATWQLVSYVAAPVNELLPAALLRPGERKGEWVATTGDGRATVQVRTFKGRVVLKVRG
ncbi:MAG: hypothetical protein JNM53_08375 [Gemmatimonadetes bacterium]|nr:hypothetical protein [Gemmatimonadota bacterium]